MNKSMIVPFINPPLKQQSGVALVIGLVLMLVITLIAVAGLTNSSIQAKMASNLQQRNDTFQAAESAISQVMIEISGIPSYKVPCGEGCQPNVVAAVAGSSQVLSSVMDLGHGNQKKVSLTDLAPANIAVSITYTYLQSSGLTVGISLNADENSTIIGPTKFILEGDAVMAASGAKAKISQGISYE